MNCDQARQLLHAYIDDELDLATALQMEAHLASCTGCQKDWEAAKIVRAAVARTASYFPAPAAVRDRLMRSMLAEKDVTPWWKKTLAFSGLAAALVLMLGSILLLVSTHASSGQIAELVGSHVRSLEADHLMDVQSTDQHTVKPWFAGKLDFSPPVIDLAADGFPLVGGRLDYLDHQKVAALIYRRNKHIINLFIWPGGGSAVADSKQGFNLIRFECRGMICWAVSDLNAAELRQFVELYKSQSSH